MTFEGKLLALLRSFPPAEPSRKRCVGEMITYVESFSKPLSILLILGRWSSKFGEFPAGDPEIHHVAGSIFADGNDPPFQV
jgi:hypothetical protein